MEFQYWAHLGPRLYCCLGINPLEESECKHKGKPFFLLSFFFPLLISLNMNVFDTEIDVYLLTSTLTKNAQTLGLVFASRNTYVTRVSPTGKTGGLLKLTSWPLIEVGSCHDTAVVSPIEGTVATIGDVGQLETRGPLATAGSKGKKQQVVMGQILLQVSLLFICSAIFYSGMLYLALLTRIGRA